MQLELRDLTLNKDLSEILLMMRSSSIALCSIWMKQLRNSRNRQDKVFHKKMMMKNLRMEMT